MRCHFCGEVPDELPHLCLLDARKKHDEAMYEFALREAAWEAERSQYRRQIATLSRHIGSIEERISAAESRLAPESA